MGLNMKKKHSKHQLRINVFGIKNFSHIITIGWKVLYFLIIWSPMLLLWAAKLSIHKVPATKSDTRLSALAFMHSPKKTILKQGGLLIPHFNGKSCQ